MNKSLKMGCLKLDTDSRRLYKAKKRLCLQNKEFELLEFMFKNKGKVLSRTSILEEVWDRNIFCKTNTVDVHISRLRKKIKDFSDFNPIKTVHSVGYICE